MSQQNVEVVQRLYRAWQRDGFGVVPELMDPAIEWVNPSYAVVSTRSLGNDVPIDAERGYVFDIRDGKVVRFAWFNDPTEALEAVGLEE